MLPYLAALAWAGEIPPVPTPADRTTTTQMNSTYKRYSTPLHLMDEKGKHPPVPMGYPGLDPAPPSPPGRLPAPPAPKPP